MLKPTFRWLLPVFSSAAGERDRIYGLLTSLDDALKKTQKLIRTASTWFPVTLFLSLCPGLSLWLFIHSERIAALGSNSIPGRERMYLLIWVIASIAISLLVCTAGHLYLRRRREMTLEHFFRTFNRYASVVVILPMFLFLRSENIGKDHPFISIFTCLAMGLVAVYFAYQIHGKVTLGLGNAALRASMPLFVVGLMSLIYALLLSHYHIIHHHNLQTRAGDLGYYVNTLWQSLRGNFLRCSYFTDGTHINRHFDPILVLISPILLIENKAETLLVFQSFWVASGAIPMYLIAKHHLGKAWFGIAFAAAYLLHPAVQGPTMFDFHSMTLAGPVLLWCMYALDAGRNKTYFAFLSLLFLIREDMPVLAILMGLYAFLSGKSLRVAALTVLTAAVYGVLVRWVVMADAVSYRRYFTATQIPGYSTAASIGVTLLTNPLYLFFNGLTEKKVIYILKLIIPLLGLPLLAGKYRILFIWGFGATLLGIWTGFWSTGTHYSIMWLPFFFASVPATIKNLSSGPLAKSRHIQPDRMAAALGIGILVSTLSMSVLYGVFWPNPSFLAGYTRFTREPTAKMKAQYETVEELVAMIPDDASVLASTHLSPHLSLRPKIWCITEEIDADSKPDYVAILKSDLKTKKKQKKKWLEKNMEQIGFKEDYEIALDKHRIALYRRK